MKILILLISFLTSLTIHAQEVYFKGEVSGRMQLDQLRQVNDEANRIFEYSPTAYSNDIAESNRQLEKTLKTRLQEPDFNASVVQLNSQLKQFLTSGGILFVEKPSIEHQNAGMTAFSEIGPINPLLLVLTRSIGYGAMDSLTADLSGITKHAVLSVVAGATGILAFPALFYFRYKKAEIEEAGRLLEIARKCALVTLFENLSWGMTGCESEPAVIKNISDFRALAASSRLYSLLKENQFNQNLSIFYGVNLIARARKVEFFPMTKVNEFVSWMDKAVEYRAFSAFVDLGMMTAGHNEFEKAMNGPTNDSKPTSAPAPSHEQSNVINNTEAGG